MGCGGISKETKVDVGEDIAKIIAKLDLKIDDYEEIFKKNIKEVEEKQQKQLEKRHEKLLELKKNNEITEEKIKELNKEDLEVEIEFLSNKADKMHFIFDTGLEFAEPVRKLTIDQLLDKAKNSVAVVANKIKKKIEEIKEKKLVEFIDSTFGKCIKDALVKKGLSKTVLTSYKNELFTKRKERREKERKEFDIKENEFESEFDNMELDLFSLVVKEFKDIDKNFKEYFRDVLVDAAFTSAFNKKVEII